MMKQLMIDVKKWIVDAGELIKKRLAEPLVVEEKSGVNDLVTNVDKEIEAFLIAKIREYAPNDFILGEEGLGDKVTSVAGRLWIIDPIDGTLNFVKQKENFCVMLAIFENGEPQLGFIYNVMKNEFIYGGKKTGVYCNEQLLSAPANTALHAGLVGINGLMFAENQFAVQEIALASSGVRAQGCAGVEFNHLFLGRQTAYLSKLSPWDYAPAMALGEALGMLYKRLDDEAIDITSGRVPFMMATKKTYQDIHEKYMKNRK